MGKSIIHQTQLYQLINQCRALMVLIIWFLFFPFLIQAANPLNVVINEIAWMGTTLSGNDEWIELYNNTEKSLNLEGWILKAADGKPEIKLSGTIPANGFYLLERTDDNTLPNIPADQIYKEALGNKGENLELYDNLGNLIDSVNCSSGWFAGDNKSTKQTMERKNPQISGNNPDNWISSGNPGGTPKTKNSVAIEEVSKEQVIEPKLKSEPESLFSEEKPKSITYPSGIIINEILPSPEGPDEQGEWIEIFNKNDFEVNLSDWQISDTEGATKTYVFPKGTIIAPKGFLVLSRQTTKIALNNGGDNINLIQPDGKIIDSVSYENAPRNQSYNREDLKWLWSTTLTPGLINIISAPIKEVKSSQEEIKKTAPKKETEKTLLKKELAAIGEPFQEVEDKQIPKFFSVFLIALTIAIFSGIIILILKKKLKQIALSKKIE